MIGALVCLGVGFAVGSATTYALCRSLTGSVSPSRPAEPVNRLHLVEPPRVTLGDVVAAGIALTPPPPEGDDAA